MENGDCSESRGTACSAEGAPAQKPPRIRVIRPLRSRIFGWALSITLHSMVALLASLSVAGSGLGRGGGVDRGSGEAPSIRTDGLSFEVSLSQPQSRLEFERETETDVAPRRVILDDPPDESTMEEFNHADIDPFSAESREWRPPLRKEPSPGRTPRDWSARLPLEKRSGEHNGVQQSGSNLRVSQPQGAGDSGDGGAGAGELVGVSTPSPVYPLSAKRRLIEGTVVVEFEVLSDGACTAVKVAESSGHDVLDQAALEAVRKWKYQPASVAKRGANVVERVRFVFKLE